MRLATRGSALALAQAEIVRGALEAQGAEVEVLTVRTGGDAGTAPPGDKSRWVEEIEQALLAGRADLAVHSAKDVPGELPDGLAIVGVPGPRADPRDALVGADSLASLPSGARVGTSSLRRRSQLLALRPDLVVEDMRGNVDTRLRKAGEWDAIVLARAGLDRLGRADGSSPLGLDELTPAPGQGCLALQARAGDAESRALAEAVTDRVALLRLTAERACVEALGATCDTPVGAHATVEGAELALISYAGLADGSHWVRDSVTGSTADPTDLGRLAAGRMVSAGAAEILAVAQSVV